MKHFHNSINLSGVALLEADARAGKQKKDILNIFKLFSEYSFRAYDIEQVMIKNCMDINHDSCKRAITNLTKQGLLIKSERPACLGPYGRSVYVWQYNTQAKGVAA